MFVSPPADNENHTKEESPQTTSASGAQEQLWRSSQAQALSPVKLPIQPQSLPQRNHTVSRKFCHPPPTWTMDIVCISPRDSTYTEIVEME